MQVFGRQVELAAHPGPVGKIIGGSRYFGLRETSAGGGGTGDGGPSGRREQLTAAHGHGSTPFRRESRVVEGYLRWPIGRLERDVRRRHRLRHTQQFARAPSEPATLATQGTRGPGPWGRPCAPARPLRVRGGTGARVTAGPTRRAPGSPPGAGAEN